MTLSIRVPLLGLSLLAGSLVVSSSPFLTKSVSAQSHRQRYVEVTQGSGVTNPQGQSANVGDRLGNNSEISINAGGSATLSVDDGIGTVKVAENSNVRVKSLNTLPDGAKTTRFYLSKGQVNSTVRPFTNSKSSFEIETPGGVAGTRGTEFGVTVDSTGKTGLTTTQGKIAFTAQGRTVMVEPGFSSLIIPGQAPTTPQRTSRDTRLRVQLLSATENNQVRVMAEVNPVNLISINGQVVDTGLQGRINTLLPIPADRVVRVVVQTPLGDRQIYELEVSG